MNAKRMQKISRNKWSGRVAVWLLVWALLALALASCVQVEKTPGGQEQPSPADLLDYPQVAGMSDEGYLPQEKPGSQSGENGPDACLFADLKVDPHQEEALEAPDSGRWLPLCGGLIAVV